MILISQWTTYLSFLYSLSFTSIPFLGPIPTATFWTSPSLELFWQFDLIKIKHLDHNFLQHSFNYSYGYSTTTFACFPFSVLAPSYFYFSSLNSMAHHWSITLINLLAITKNPLPHCSLNTAPWQNHNPGTNPGHLIYTGIVQCLLEKNPKTMNNLH